MTLLLLNRAVSAQTTPPASVGDAVPIPPAVARKSPAHILIKVDDLRKSGKTVHPRWQRLVDFLKQRKIKAGIGIICNSLEGDNPEYVQWIKSQRATGLIEFWNHGYDHRQWTENDKKLQEFVGTSYEHQKEHLTRANRLAREKLGFTLPAFGAPFNATDATTIKVLQEDVDTKIWLYGDIRTTAGKLVLDRVGRVNIENPIFKPSLEKFVDGYNRYPDRKFFVIQGHPSQWTDDGFEQFVKIVDFLTGAGAIFTTPTEYAQRAEMPAR
jgi:peptidoglycan/xylan/chitin deacetylase (PgdA/CDA1 family)